MARFDIFREQPFALFPMFNILICVLGCLIFILILNIILSIGISKSIVLDSEVFKQRANNMPTYVEWDGTNLIVHPTKEKATINIDEDKFDTFEELNRNIENQINATSLGRILHNISTDKKGKYIIVLVRPSGFNNFINIRDYIISKDINIGYEPINQSWKIQIK